MLEADYLCIGAGAMGMAFVDIILHETTDKTIILVDDHMQPGGHWNDSYPFVTLHQPATYYGVNSRTLEKAPLSTELASKSEILAYYQEVLAELLETGRLKYFPMCRAENDLSQRTFRSLVQPDLVWKVGPDAKIVDSTYMKVWKIFHLLY